MSGAEQSPDGAGQRADMQADLPPAGAAARHATLGPMSGTDHRGDIVAAPDLHRRYGEGEAAVDALDDVTVSFPEQRFAAIMGPSGSGKSTLMHNLAGLDRPTSGSVCLAGVELTDLDDRKL